MRPNPLMARFIGAGYGKRVADVRSPVKSLIDAAAMDIPGGAGIPETQVALGRKKIFDDAAEEFIRHFSMFNSRYAVPFVVRSTDERPAAGGIGDNDGVMPWKMISSGFLI